MDLQKYLCSTLKICGENTPLMLFSSHSYKSSQWFRDSDTHSAHQYEAGVQRNKHIDRHIDDAVWESKQATKHVREAERDRNLWIQAN